MKRSWIGLSLVTAVSLLGSGCGNPCEGATDRITKRYEEECGLTIAVPEEPAEEVVCADADATYLDCLADCAESATCEAITGEDSEGAVDFGKCNGDCRN